MPRVPRRLTIVCSRVLSSVALPRQGSAESSASAERENSLSGTLKRGAALAHEVVRQRRNVFLAIAQRRHVDADRRQAPVEGLFDAAVVNRDLDALIGGRDAAHVERDVRALLDERRLAVAQQTREPALHARRRLDDVLQVERAVEGVVQTTAAAQALEPVRRQMVFVDAGRDAEEFLLELLAVETPRSRSSRIAPTGSCRRVNRPGHPAASRAGLTLDQDAGADGGRREQ